MNAPGRNAEKAFCVIGIIACLVSLLLIVQVCCAGIAHVSDNNLTIDYVTIDTSCDCYWVLAWYTSEPAQCSIEFCTDSLCFPAEYESDYQKVHIKILPDTVQHIKVTAIDIYNQTTEWETNLCDFLSEKPECQVW